MEKIINELKVWLEGLNDSKLPEFETLPDVNLYMDQIVSYIDTILSPYSRDEQKLITSFMVNNYVKAKIIEAPTLKRYNKNQLSYLIAICLLKQITSMSNMAVILNKENFQDENGEFYNHFIKVHNSLKDKIHDSTLISLDKVSKGEKPNPKGRRKKETDEEIPASVIRKNLVDLSLKLMIESELNKMVAERILYELGKETYNDPKLFEQKHNEVKFDKKKTKFETSRIKKVNIKNEKKSTEN